MSRTDLTYATTNAEMQAPGYGFVKILWLRYLFCVLVGNQFRRPSIGDVGMVTVFLLGEMYHVSVSLNPYSSHDLRKSLYENQEDNLIWTFAVVQAVVTIRHLRLQRRRHKWIFRAFCALALHAMASDLESLYVSFPFLGSTFRCLSFTIVVVVSTIDHYRLQHRAKLMWEQYQLSGVAGLLRFLRKEVESQGGLTKRQEELQIAAEQLKVIETTRSPDSEIEQPKTTGTEDSIDYKPLGKDGIRLLKFKQGANTPTATPEFELTYHDLPDVQGGYLALSYCWGTENTGSLIIDNKVIKARTNLREALDELDLKEGVLIWVDAICINQKDIFERNSQVLRMLSIFQQAEKVVAWLGSSDEASDRVMTCLQACPIESSETLENAILEDLKTFMGRDFWRRIWIIQELAAAREVSIACSSKQSSLENVSALLDSQKNSQAIDERHWPIFLERRQLIENILNIRRRRNDVKRQGLGLLESLNMTKASKCSVLHDRVYGLLGLVDNSDLYLSAPKYDLKPSEISMDMTKTFLRARKSLDIMLIAPRTVSSNGLPSWCPDYFNITNFSFNDVMVKYLEGNYPCFRLGEKGKTWKSTTTSKAIEKDTYSFSDNGNVLRVRGVLAGTIDAIGSIPGRDNGFVKLSPTSDSTESKARTLKRNGRGVCSALQRVLLIYDKNYNELATESNVLSIFFHDWNRYYAATRGQFAEEVLEWRRENSNFEINGKSLHQIAQSPGGTYSRLLSWWNTAKVLSVYEELNQAVGDIISEGMPLITTLEGSIGWGHASAALKDQIFLLPGCSLPVILRPVSKSRFTVVGHAYLDGYMDGKRWEESSKERKFIYIL